MVIANVRVPSQPSSVNRVLLWSLCDTSLSTRWHVNRMRESLTGTWTFGRSKPHTFLPQWLRQVRLDAIYILCRSHWEAQNVCWEVRGMHITLLKDNFCKHWESRLAILNATVPWIRFQLYLFTMVLSIVHSLCVVFYVCLRTIHGEDDNGSRKCF